MIRVGPAGWDYRDWSGVVFPQPRPKSFDPLAYLAEFYATIEINSTFYRPVAPEVARDWVRRVAARPDFKFTAKLWRRFSHERTSAFTSDEVAEARRGLDAIQEAGRLGAVLLQFPWSFRCDDANREWLRDVVRAFSDYPLVVEVRHATWNDAGVLAWLAEQSVGMVNIDQPLFHDSIRPAALVTAPVGYVRLHGRNYQDWFRKTAGRNDRYQYLYTADELAPWVARIKQVAARATETYAVTNNHPDGRAPANASMIDAMLTGRRARVPASLFQRYSDLLRPYAEPAPPPPGQASLPGV
jgi:uncharacterized protein YecE (DUF72 family)